jgi:predicted permease
MNPGFTALAVTTIALAVGACAAIFSIVEAVLLRPLPFRDPARLVLVWNEYRGEKAHSSVPDYLDRRAMSRTLEGLGAFSFADANLTDAGEPVRVRIGQATSSFFEVTGRDAAMGRVVTRHEETPGRHAVVVLADGFWRRAFGARPSLLGESVRIDGVPHTIVGVMPPDFGLPAEPVDLWRPLAFTPAQMGDNERGNESLLVIGRVKPGVALPQVEAEMDTIAASVLERVPRRRAYLQRSQWGAAVVPLTDYVAGPARATLLVIAGAVGLVLLMACANVANLLLVRGSYRQREMAVRVALGATRGRLLRQLVTEGLLLGLAGGAAGAAIAYWIVRVAAEMPLPGVPRLDESVIDLPVLGFTLAISVASALLFGLWPAVQTARGAVSMALAGSGRASATPARRRGRSAVIAAEVAFAVVVLVGAGLLLRSFERLARVDPGFVTEHRYTANVSLPAAGYPEPAARLAFFGALADRLRALPHVRAVGLTHLLPLSGRRDTANFTIDGYTSAPGEANPGGEYRFVDGEYFRAMGIPLVRGRVFEPQDDAGSQPVAIVDEGAAARYFANRDPIGGRIDVGGSGQRWRQIVGLVGTVRSGGLDAAPRPQVYLAVAQNPRRSLAVVLQSDGDPDALASDLRSAVAAIDPHVPIFEAGTLDERVGRSIARQRYAAALLAALAVLALTLAAIGLYGLVAFWVSREARQIGIRVALGATGDDVRRLVLRQGLVPVAAGLAAGLAAAAVLSTLARSQLFGIGPTDAVTYGTVAVGLLIIALAACALPARRAAATDPVRALRGE